jgi:hypothetical protein
LQLSRISEISKLLDATIIYTNAMLDVNNEYTIGCIQLLSLQRQFHCNKYQGQKSVNDFYSSTIGNQWAALPYAFKVNGLVSIKVKHTNNMLGALS